MELILLENIMNLGNIGDRVQVKPGYGRNFLLKTGKALRFNKENLEYVSKKKDELNKKNIELKKKLKNTAQVINNKSFTFNKESKENGDLYAFIKPKEISTAFENQLKTEIKPSQIILKTDINKVGNYSLEVNLYPEVSSIVKIKVDKLSSIKS